jgi:GNAT superfamily N-acetyltransferase
MNRMRDFGRQELAQRFDLHFGTTNNEFVLRRDLREGRRLFANQIDVLERTTVDAAAPADVPGVAIREVAAFDDRIEDFWRAASQPFDVAVVRSREYLNWRYADPRAGRFTILLAECDAQLIGYAVLSTSGDKGQIADLLVLPERRDVLQALLEAALTQLASSGASRVQVWSPLLHPYRDTFVTKGFNATRTMQGVTLGAYRPDLAGALAILDDPRAAVHITAGDTDLV